MGNVASVDSPPRASTSADPTSGAVSMTDAVVNALAVIGAGVDVLQGLLKVVETDPERAGATEPAVWRSVLERVDRVGRSLSAGRVRVARIGEQVRVAGQEGQVDTGSWVATTTRTTRTDAARLMDLARGLHGLPTPSPTRAGEAATTSQPGATGAPGSGVPAAPARLTVTEAALDAGDLSVEHARIILATMAALPTHLSAEDRAAIESRLVDQARVMDPGQLRRLARRAVESIEPDPALVDETENATLADEEELAYRASSFWIKDNCDGTMSGGFTVPWVSGAALKTVLDAMTAPRRDTTPTTTTMKWPDRRASQKKVWPDRSVGNGGKTLMGSADANPGSAATGTADTQPGTPRRAGTQGPDQPVPEDRGSPGARQDSAPVTSMLPELLNGGGPGEAPAPHGHSRLHHNDDSEQTTSDSATVGNTEGTPRPAADTGRTTGTAPANQPASGRGADSGWVNVESSDGGAGEPRGPDSWKDRMLHWQQRRGMAFADLLTLIPTDHLPNKAAATVVVHTDLDTLRGLTDKAGATSAGDSLSAAAVRRAACLAGIVPAVLAKDSTPLDLGRTTRLFTAAQRLALSTRYDSCAAAGCDRPFAWTEIHHLHPWEAGGRTDLVNAVPLCGFHHRRLHQLGIRHEVHRDAFGRITITFSQT